MKVEPILFYHIAQMHHWRDVVEEQLQVLKAAEFSGNLYMGIVGEGHDRWPQERATELGLKCEIVARSQNILDYEAPTLRALEMAARAGYEGPIGYIHTKGVSMPTDATKMFWRWIMNLAVLVEWKDRVAELATHDVAGFCWEDCDPHAHFCGNFWWARADWIRGLSGFDWYFSKPWCGNMRLACEQWISSCNLREPERRVASAYLRSQGNAVHPIWTLPWWQARPMIRGMALRGSGVVGPVKTFP